MKNLRRFAAICVFIACPLMTYAEIHSVSIRNLTFSPNDLVIRPGDTVRWTFAPVQDGNCAYGCSDPVLHSVVADDQSFTSGEPAEEFVYERTFPEPGEVLYHCSQHSEPGKDINNFMNGRIAIEAEGESGFQINPGLNDAWYDPATSGQGFLISVFPDISQVFLAWFTFDTERPPEDSAALLGDPGHRWLTAQGPYAGDTTNLTVFVTEGGVFDSAEPATTTDPAGDGSMTIEFADCSSALVTYEITSLGISGEIPIQRIVPDNVPLCEALINP